MMFLRVEKAHKMMISIFEVYIFHFSVMNGKNQFKTQLTQFHDDLQWENEFWNMDQRII